MVKLQTQGAHNSSNIVKQQIPCHMFIKQSAKVYIRLNTIVWWCAFVELHIMVPWSWYFDSHVWPKSSSQGWFWSSWCPPKHPARQATGAPLVLPGASCLWPFWNAEEHSKTPSTALVAALISSCPLNICYGTILLVLISYAVISTNGQDYMFSLVTLLLENKYEHLIGLYDDLIAYNQNHWVEVISLVFWIARFVPQHQYLSGCIFPSGSADTVTVLAV